MNPSENTPFPHTVDCKTPDATPEWIPRGEGHYERICTCHTQVHYPPMWRRPDILDPSVMQHEKWCEIADKPELLKVAVRVKHESSYDFATCGVCSRSWYAWDQPPVEANRR